MKTTDKVQVGDSTTRTSTSTTISSSSPVEYGWVCPRCNKVNAPWKSTCDCSGGYYHPTWYPWDYREPWWKQVYYDSDTFKVHPETTTWKAPSSTCKVDSSMNDPNQVTTTWSAINNANSAMDTGGSDYWNSVTKNWENVPHTLTNMQKELDEIKSTFSNTLRGE